MNGTGYGRATANVTSGTGAGAAATSTAQGPTADVQQPPQAVSTAAFSALPSGATTSTKSLIQGLPGYIWKATTLASGGDKTDNDAIQNMNAPVTPQAFALLQVDSTVQDNGNGSSTVTFNGISTGGTALLVRGLEWTGTDKNGNPTLPTPEELQALADGTAVPSGINNFNVAALSEDDKPTLPAYYTFDPKLLVGDDDLDPSNLDFSKFLTQVDVPNGDPEFFLFVDGLATSTVPDSGSSLGMLGLAACGMLIARRFNARASA